MPVRLVCTFVYHHFTPGRVKCHLSSGLHDVHLDNFFFGEISGGENERLQVVCLAGNNSWCCLYRAGKLVSSVMPAHLINNIRSNKCNAKNNRYQPGILRRVV